MALIDSDSQMIPDSLQIALLVVAVGAVFADRETAWPDKLYGLCLGGGFFLLFYLLSYPMFGREGLGFGDVKLMAGAGLLLGLKATAAAIAFALAPAFLAVVLRRRSLRRPGQPHGRRDVRRSHRISRSDGRRAVLRQRPRRLVSQSTVTARPHKRNLV